jgi:HEAT repeat protein
MNFSRALENLLDAGAPLKPSVLFSLSKLEAAEMERLAAVWPSISAARRRALMKELVEITETNFEVDFEPIFRWGLHDSDSEVRAASVEGLWENEELALMTELLRLLQNDPSVQVRAAAALSLGRFILLGELGKLPFERCQSAYTVMCDLIVAGTEDLEVRRRALESVAYVSDERVAHLLQEAYGHPDEKMRISSVFGMGRSADPRWIDTVMGELFSVSPEMRYEAARACGELEARPAVSRLAELIDDPDREVQEVALWALGQIGGDEARQLLQTCCLEGDEVTRSAAEAALEELEFRCGQLDLPFYAFDDLDDIEPDMFP